MEKRIADMSGKDAVNKTKRFSYVTYVMQSDPFIDQQMKFVAKLVAMHRKMSHYNLFRVNMCRHYFKVLMLAV